MQPRDAVVVDVEVLADQLAQQPMRRLDSLVVEQPVGLLDGPQRALGVLGDPGQHPLALGLLAPAAVGLLARPRVVELQAVIKLARGLLVDRRDRVKQLADAVTDQPDRVLRRGRAEHRRRVDDLLDRPVEHAPAPRRAASVRSSATRSLPCSNSRARNFVNDVGCQPS